MTAGEKINCGICRGAAGSVFMMTRVDGYGECVLKECGQCGAVFIDPLPPEEVLNKFYEADYYSGITGAGSGVAGKKLGNELRKLKILNLALKGMPGKAVLLDVGCGDGGFVRLCRAEGLDARGIESGCRIREEDRAFIARGNFEKTGAAGEKYDAVTFWHSLEHMRDPSSAIKKAADILNGGGVLIAAVPDRSSLDARLFGAKWAHYDLPRHLYHFSAGSLGQLLGRHGFEVEKVIRRSRENDVYSIKKSLQNVLGWRPEKRNVLYSVFWKAVEYFAEALSFPCAALGVSSTVTVIARKRKGP